MASFVFTIHHDTLPAVFEKDFNGGVKRVGANTGMTMFEVEALSRDAALALLLPWIEELNWYSIENNDHEFWSTEEEDTFQDRCGDFEEDGAFDDWGDGLD